MRRLPLTPYQVGCVVAASHHTVCVATVTRWLHGHDGHRAQDAAIVAALAQLDLHPVRRDPMAEVERETRQLVLAAVDVPVCTGAEFAAAAQAAIEPRTDDEIADILASVQGEPAPVAEPPAPPAPTPPRRRGIRVEIGGQVLTLDQLAQYEEPAGQGPG